MRLTSEALYTKESHKEAVMLGIPLSVDARNSERKIAVHDACVAEILTFWDRLNNCGEIYAELKSHLDGLRKGKETGQFPDIFRRSLDDDCFSLSCRNPLALSELGEESTRYLHLSAGARHLVARFNWLNIVSKDIKSLDFWIEYHRDTVKVFDKILDRSRKMLRKLGDQETDLSEFQFSRTVK